MAVGALAVFIPSWIFLSQSPAPPEDQIPLWASVTRVEAFTNENYYHYPQVSLEVIEKYPALSHAIKEVDGKFEAVRKDACNPECPPPVSGQPQIIRAEHDFSMTKETTIQVIDDLKKNGASFDGPVDLGLTGTGFKIDNKIYSLALSVGED